MFRRVGGWLLFILRAVFTVGSAMITVGSLALDALGMAEPLGIKWSWIALASFALFVLIFVIHNIAYQRRLQPRVELVYGRSPTYQHEFPASIDGEQTRLRLFRVGLRNKGGETIHGYRVIVREIAPVRAAILPAEPNIMHRGRMQEGLALYPGESPSEFVDLVHCTLIPVNGEQCCMFQFALPEGRLVVPASVGDLRVVLEVTGNNMPAVSMTFAIAYESDEPVFSEYRPTWRERLIGGNVRQAIVDHPNMAFQSDGEGIGPEVGLRIRPYPRTVEGHEQYVALEILNQEGEELTDCRGVLVYAQQSYLFHGVDSWHTVIEHRQLAWSQLSPPASDEGLTIATGDVGILDIARTDGGVMKFTLRGGLLRPSLDFLEPQSPDLYRIEVVVSGKKQGIPFQPIHWSGYVQYLGGIQLNIGTDLHEGRVIG